MFTLKQISTIKKVLSEDDNKNLKQSSEDSSQNLILKTERLQEIYHKVCLTEVYDKINEISVSSERGEAKDDYRKANEENDDDKSDQNRPSQITYPDTEERESLIFRDTKVVIDKLLTERQSLRCKLTEALNKLEEHKLKIRRQNNAKIKKMQHDLKNYNTLEQTWKKSREALLKENKILMDELNKAQTKIKGVKHQIEAKFKIKISKLKNKIQELRDRLKSYEDTNLSNEEDDQDNFKDINEKVQRQPRRSKKSIHRKLRSFSASPFASRKSRFSSTSRANKLKSGIANFDGNQSFKKKIKELNEVSTLPYQIKYSNLSSKLLTVFRL